MNSVRRFSALLLALVYAVFAAAPTPAGGSVKAEQQFVLAPGGSEGVTIAETSAGSMGVAAHEDGGSIVFDETKELSFTVSFGDGWLRCDRYSRFFPGDSRAVRTVLADGRLKCVFRAAEGGSVSLEEWESVCFNASCSELPKLFIDAAEDFENIDRETWVDASYTLTLGTKEFSSGDYEGTGKVKGRGNSSWAYPKKPYSIKLDSKASWLDIPKTKKYAVIPSYQDGSLMRNYITYKGFAETVGIGYVPRCEFVDVYLNGEYNGIYLLTERIDIEKSKVDIEEADADNMTGGYLIEKDINGRVDFDSDLWFDCPYWANEAKDLFVLKAPEPDDPELADAMLLYLAAYMQRVHGAIMGTSGEDWHNYVDTSSWADFIIIQEIAKNIDGPMKTSCWLYKDRDDDHIYMTAPWDFDLAYGRVNWNNQAPGHNDADDCPNADTPEGFMILNSSNPWMDRLYDTEPEFARAVKERYTEYRGTLTAGLLPMIEEQAAYLSVVQEPNYELWHMGFHSSVALLKNWLVSRIEWLDGEWLVELPTYEQGDADMNGIINAADALLALRAAMGLVTLDDAASALADYDGSGTLTAGDALLILRFSMGLN
ncbi:MAG: CotH kinase family protein [Clostridia bacterium]|nr:CotH kinase family protein [Clostridia bacterium]